MGHVLVKDFPHPGCLYAGVTQGGGAGSCELDSESLQAAGIMRLLPLTDIEPNIGVCNANACIIANQAGTRLAKDWLLGAAERAITG